MGKLRNLLNPTRARLQGVLIVAVVVFVGMLVSRGLWSAGDPVQVAFAGTVWAVVAYLAAGYILERRIW